MVLMLILNAMLGVGVTVMIVAPRVWAIRTQYRDQPAAPGAAGRAPKGAAAPGRRSAHRVAWTAS